MHHCSEDDNSNLEHNPAEPTWTGLSQSLQLPWVPYPWLSAPHYTSLLSKHLTDHIFFPAFAQAMDWGHLSLLAQVKISPQVSGPQKASQISPSMLIPYHTVGYNIINLFQSMHHNCKFTFICVILRKNVYYQAKICNHEGNSPYASLLIYFIPYYISLCIMVLDLK
jgi:hypothetical protein